MEPILVIYSWLAVGVWIWTILFTMVLVGMVLLSWRELDLRRAINATVVVVGICLSGTIYGMKVNVPQPTPLRVPEGTEFVACWRDERQWPQRTIVNYVTQEGTWLSARYRDGKGDIIVRESSILPP